ncbi:hypothetical protein [Bacillus thuringiensis]|uniref:hypothetical protein n=1 Tax=Bacillus thuringiensis TaxID=1428 RepID=UPI002A4664E0|nr:hypothetical protein [Bacillus cereus]MDA2496760.1 hypothetical protein [Bacillus cereus]
MKKIMRELKMEELEKHKGGIDIIQNGNAYDGSANLSCKELYSCWKFGACGGMDAYQAYVAYTRHC